MAPLTPVRGTATSANDAPVAPRRGRPPKPTEKIREAQATLGLRTTGARQTTLRTILPTITVAEPTAQQNDDALDTNRTEQEGQAEAHRQPEWQITIMEEFRGYRAVIQAMGSELKEAKRDRQAQLGVIQSLQELVKEAGEEGRKGWDEARKGWEEARTAREETRLAREESQKSKEEFARKLEVMQAELGTVKEQFETTLGAVKLQFETALAKITEDLSNLSSRPPSWATVAARGSTAVSSPAVISPNTSQGNSHSVSPFSSVSQEKAAGLLGVEIELGSMQNPPFNVGAISVVKSRLRQAFDAHPVTNAIPVTGISRKGDTATSYRFRVGDEENVKKVKENREWLVSHFEGAKIKEDTEYLVVVDGVDKETICNPTKTMIRPTAHEEIGQENNISISKIRFLGNGNPGRNKCSVILHMPDKREADQLTSRQYMEFGDEMVFTRKFLPMLRNGPQRCYKCQRLGDHKARDCPNQEATCEKCGADGHRAETCESATTKCINCSGSHRASDKRCPAFVSVVQGYRQSLNV